jgi:16S rRNA (guanine527-N7)-methyltransferase
MLIRAFRGAVWFNDVLRMETSRIAALLQPFLTWPLSDRQLRDISTYIDMLLKWNQRMNLTAVRNPEEIVTRHFGESLFAAQALFPARRGTAASGRPAEQSSASPTKALFDSAQAKPGSQRNEVETSFGSQLTVADIGSGPGFPGLPIKIWAPDIRLTLIESNHKKATFTKEVVRALRLEGVEVFTGRAENFPAASADVVTLRAVERFIDVLAVAIERLRTGGRLALLVGEAQIDTARATELLWQEPIKIPQSNARVLLLGTRRSPSHSPM